MTTKEKISDLIEVCQQEAKQREKILEKEIGEFEIAEKKASEKGFPGKTPQHLEALKYCRDLKERLEKVKKILEVETEELEKHKNKARERKKKYTKKDIQGLVGLYDRAAKSIEASIMISQGKRYEDVPAGKTDTFPTKENLDSMEKIPEKKGLKQFREKHTHRLLGSAELLRNRDESLESLETLKEKDMEKLEKLEEDIEEISKDITERASKLDSFLLKASIKLNKAEERKQKYS